MTVSNPVDKWWFRLPLVVLATLRLTRFITSDWLGEWALVSKAKAWAEKYEEPARRKVWESLGYPRPPYEHWDTGDPSPITWQGKLVKGLDCPFCVGFWIGGLVIAGEVLTRTRLFRWARPIWTFTLAALALNEVVGHISSRIDG